MKEGPDLPQQCRQLPRGIGLPGVAAGASPK